MMYVAIPLGKDVQIQGILRTSIPLTDIDAELVRIQNNIALGGFLIAVLASVICFYVSRRISQPIEKLKMGAENFRQSGKDFRGIDHKHSGQRYRYFQNASFQTF